MIQLQNTIDANPKMRGRFQRLDVFKELLVKTINRLLTWKSDYEVPELDFLFGGYCWFHSRFKIWAFKYGHKDRSFYSIQLTNGVYRKGDFPIFFIGDYLDVAKQAVLDVLKTHSSFTSRNYIDMEPFEAIVSMLSDPARELERPSIGGRLNY